MDPKRTWAVFENGRVRELDAESPEQGRSKSWRLPAEWGDYFVMQDGPRTGRWRSEGIDKRPRPESVIPQRKRPDERPPESVAPWQERPEPDFPPWSGRSPSIRMTTRDATKGTARPGVLPGEGRTLLAAAEAEPPAEAKPPLPTAPAPDRNADQNADRNAGPNAGPLPGNPPDDRQPQYRNTGKASARLGGPDDGTVTLLDDELTPVRNEPPQPPAPASQPQSGRAGQASAPRPSLPKDKQGQAPDPASDPAPATPGDQDKDAKPAPQAPKDMRLDEEGIKFIKEAEGFSSKLYEDSAGHCTIGYGHLLHKGGCAKADHDKYPDGITEKEASALLGKDLKECQDAVSRYVKVPLTQGQYNALGSFTYNEGPDALRSSDLLKKLNIGKYHEVPNELKRWDKSTKDGVKSRNEGLARRRERESQLFKK